MNEEVCRVLRLADALTDQAITRVAAALADQMQQIAKAMEVRDELTRAQADLQAIKQDIAAAMQAAHCNRSTSDTGDNPHALVDDSPYGVIDDSDLTMGEP